MRHPNAKYIKRQKTEADDSDEEFFMRDSSSKILDKESTILEGNIISVQRLKDANISKYSKVYFIYLLIIKIVCNTICKISSIRSIIINSWF